VLQYETTDTRRVKDPLRMTWELMNSILILLRKIGKPKSFKILMKKFYLMEHQRPDVMAYYITAILLLLLAAIVLRLLAHYCKSTDIDTRNILIDWFILVHGCYIWFYYRRVVRTGVKYVMVFRISCMAGARIMQTLPLIEAR
jgi:hypothetical protein